MNAATTGGCQCGAVRYRIAQALENAHICHCRMCQKASGNYFLPLARTAKAKFAVTRGEVGWFQSSDIVRRGFCRDCGTPLLFDVVDRDTINVMLGSLDEPASVKPEFQCGPAAKMPWFGDLDTVEPSADETSWYAAIAPSNHQHPDHDTEQWPPENRS
ncbi:GFA family protein [Aminobacter sp. P9b]|uniref:GFA family protein n=1 Tax=Aminobacter sp. P9b TaxID=3133697 RepID=UPI00324B256F